MSDQLPHPVETPSGYPAEFERDLPLRDGRHVLIRPIRPADGLDIGAAIAAADETTLRMRFMGGPPRPTPALLAHLSTVDYKTRFALVAREPANGHLVAVARYERLAEGVAEVAVTVCPHWRRVGLATAMVEILAKAALDRGFSSFHASYFADNRPVSILLNLGGSGVREISQGIAECAIALDRTLVSAAVDALNDRRP